MAQSTAGCSTAPTAPKFEFVMDPRTRNRFGSDIQFSSSDTNGLKRRLESPHPANYDLKRQKWTEVDQEEESAESGRYTPYPTVKSEPESESPNSPTSAVILGLEDWIDKNVHDLVASIKDRVQDAISQKLQDAWRET